MGYRDKRERYRSREELNRGDYRGDFGPEGSRRFDSRDDRRDQRHARGQSHHESGARWDERRYAQSAGDWRWRHSGREGWQRERGYGRGYDALAAGEGFRPSGFGFGPEEGPGPGGIADRDWQPNRPARGRGRWAADWENDSLRNPDWRHGRENEHERGDDYRGRGPKDYHRADDRIREDVCERLTDDWSVDASEIIVVVQDGEVTLSGFVASREQKRRAEDVVENVGGVRDVINQLRVSREQERMARAGSPEAPSIAADRGRSKA
jgi:hypothetical protein